MEQLACPKCMSVDVELHPIPGCPDRNNAMCMTFSCNKCNHEFDEAHIETVTVAEPDDYCPYDTNDRFSDDW